MVKRPAAGRIFMRFTVVEVGERRGIGQLLIEVAHFIGRRRTGGIAFPGDAHLEFSKAASAAISVA
jgi:hypothetical protein